MKQYFPFAGALAALAIPMSVAAHDVRADDHAPIGVMADHAHKQGGIMFSARLMHMQGQGNQVGTDAIDPDTIVTTIPNRFAGMPGQPPTLRVVPREMHADMVMLGMMWAPIDEVTLVIAGSYAEKEMRATTYAGGMGTTVLGDFTSNPKGLGDMKLAALFPLVGKAGGVDGVDTDNLTFKVGLNLPTGSITKEQEVLTPMGTSATMRVPYAMQAGSGTWDIEPALTYKLRRGRLGFGVQGSAVLHAGKNSSGYTLGDAFEGTAWASYRPAQFMSLSLRTRARSAGRIDGMDPAIMGPMQATNPDFSGGDRVDMLAGVNLVATHGTLAGHRLGVELGKTVWQDLNGPQLAADWSLVVGWQKAY